MEQCPGRVGIKSGHTGKLYTVNDLHRYPLDCFCLLKHGLVCRTVMNTVTDTAFLASAECVSVMRGHRSSDISYKQSVSTKPLPPKVTKGVPIILI